MGVRSIFRGKRLRIDPLVFPVDRWEDSFLELPNDICWEWEGYIDEDGYGRFWFAGQHRLAHRISYAYYIGVIPASIDLHHTCENRRCINPFHLERKPRSRHVIYHAEKRVIEFADIPF